MRRAESGGSASSAVAPALVQTYNVRCMWDPACIAANHSLNAHPASPWCHGQASPTHWLMIVTATTRRLLETAPKCARDLRPRADTLLCNMRRQNDMSIWLKLPHHPDAQAAGDAPKMSYEGLLPFTSTLLRITRHQDTITITRETSNLDLQAAGDPHQIRA